MAAVPAGYVMAQADWKKPLFSCMDNIGACCVATWLPCLTFGENNKKLGRDFALYAVLYLVPIVDCIVATDTRRIIREARGIPGDFITDFITHFFCGVPCALVQEAEELKDYVVQPQVVLVSQPQQPGYAPQPVGYAPPSAGYAPPPPGYAPPPPPAGYVPPQGYAPPPDDVEMKRI